MQRQRERPRVLTIGGGTGHYTLLSGLRELEAELTAVVTMMDSGGSIGEHCDQPLGREVRPQLSDDALDAALVVVQRQRLEREPEQVLVVVAQPGDADRLPHRRCG